MAQLQTILNQNIESSNFCLSQNRVTIIFFLF